MLTINTDNNVYNTPPHLQRVISYVLRNGTTSLAGALNALGISQGGLWAKFTANNAATLCQHGIRIHVQGLSNRVWLVPEGGDPPGEDTKPLTDRIVELLQCNPALALSPADMLIRLGAKKPNLTASLSRLVSAGIIVKVRHGLYKAAK